MFKKRYIFLGFIIVIIFLIAGPVIINWLMLEQQNKVEVKGTEDVWITSLSTYIGAIIGGVSSGLLTLFGVKLTLEKSTDQVNKTLKEQQRIRDEELKHNAIKEQLFKLYHPLNSMIAMYIFKYGSHDFSELKYDERKDFIEFITNNEIYADKELYIKILEIRWAFKEGETVKANNLYHEVIDVLTDSIAIMKEQLKLPNQEL